MLVEVFLVIANSVLDYLSRKYCCYEIIGAKVSFLIYATKKLARFCEYINNFMLKIPIFDV